MPSGIPPTPDVSDNIFHSYVFTVATEKKSKRTEESLFSQLQDIFFNMEAYFCIYNKPDEYFLNIFLLFLGGRGEGRGFILLK
jgi:hypothetical protein